MDVLAEIVKNPMFGMVSLLLAVVSVGIAVRSRRVKRASWAIRSNNLFAGFTATLPALDIRYANQKVENLTVSRVLVWNSGTETIDGRDVAEAHPLRVAGVGSARVLDVTLLKANSEPCQFGARLEPNDGAVYLHFDFLDRDQGAVIQITHTGTSSKDVLLLGTIKGAGIPRKREIRQRTR